MTRGNGLFEHPDFDDHEQVLYVNDAAHGLRAIIAIHSTLLGPALGGTRRLRYVDSATALSDVLRLSRGMTYKAAVAGLDIGGGKAVILGDGRPATTQQWEAYGDAIERLGGRFVTGEDVGTTEADIDIVRSRTRHAGGASASYGGYGDPSDTTAHGLLHAMLAVCQHRFGSSKPLQSGLDGRHVVIVGVGKVGRALAVRLEAAGAKLTIADTSSDAVAATLRALKGGADVAETASAHHTPCDIFAPCALGGALDEQTVDQLQCDAIVGAANNQLRSVAIASRIAQRGIDWAPDFVVNAGGLIHVFAEQSGRSHAWIDEHVSNIERTTLEILQTAQQQHITPLAAAEARANARLRSPGEPHQRAPGTA